MKARKSTAVGGENFWTTSSLRNTTHAADCASVQYCLSLPAATTRSLSIQHDEGRPPNAIGYNVPFAMHNPVA